MLGEALEETALPAEPPKGSPAAKAMGNQALEEARRQNRRITVHPVTTCSK